MSWVTVGIISINGWMYIYVPKNPRVNRISQNQINPKRVTRVSSGRYHIMLRQDGIGDVSRVQVNRDRNWSVS